ncbi:MAG: S1 RNA-binding domain-containing protein, partial [Bacteroidales bacterium]
MTEINDNVNVEPQKTEEVQNHEIKNEANTETVVAEEKAKPEIKPLENFNWDLIGEKDDAYSKEERAKLEELYNNTFKLIEEGEVVMGTVVAINKREVVVNIGYKSEGIINANEFRTETEIKVGDKVEVFVENMESIDGQLILSHKKAKSLKSWDRVNEAHDNDEIVKGYIKCKTKGGMIVDVFGLEAFLPGSQIDVKPIRDYDVYVGKTMEFK